MRYGSEKHHQFLHRSFEIVKSPLLCLYCRYGSESPLIPDTPLMLKRIFSDPMMVPIRKVLFLTIGSQELMFPTEISTVELLP